MIKLFIGTLAHRIKTRLLLESSMRKCHKGWRLFFIFPRNMGYKGSRVCFQTCWLGLLLLSPTLALASGGENRLTSVLSGLIGVLTSTPARLMFVVAIIGVGYGTLALGKIPKEKAVAIVIGIGIVFSASFIAQKMGLGT